jgi:hypothetical protein
MIQMEYGKPFEEVIKWYAALGYSRLKIAVILQINLSYLRMLLSKHSLHHLFDRNNYNNLCRPVGKGWPKGKLRKNQ